MIEEVRVRPLAMPALLLGIGLGGVINAVVIGWSGVLLALSWVLAVIGAVMLFRAGRRDDVVWSSRVFYGGMIFGWGVFNVVEGVIDQLVLGIHHTHRGGNTLLWDISFVVIGGIGLMLVGYLIARSEISGSRMSPATRRALGI